MQWSDIPGWSCPVLLNLYDEIAYELMPGAIFVEVGVAYGKSLAYMAAAAHHGVTLIGVDSWLVFMGRNNLSSAEWERVRQWGTPREACREMLVRVIEPEDWERLELCQGDSAAVAAALDFDVDAVFLDGSHEYEAVRRDVLAWLPRVKPGGVLAGHDANAHYPGVERAVRECLPGAEFRPAEEEGGWGGCWVWRKR